MDFKTVKAYVEGLNIQGLSRTSEKYLRAHLGSALFEAKNFEEVLAASDKMRRDLYKLGCFKSVEVLVDSSDDESRPSNYRVFVKLEEESTIGGSVHTSIGNNEGSLSTSVYFPNMLGKGERLSAEYTCGTRNHVDYRLNFTSPVSLNPEHQFSSSVFKSKNDFPWSKYSEHTTGVSLDILKPFSLLLKDKYLVSGTHIFSYEGTWRQLVSNMDATFDVREQSGHSFKSSIKYTNIIDRRDHNNLPTQGGYLKTSGELAGLGGDVNFLRFNLDYQYTKTFFDYFTTQITFSKGVMAPWRPNTKLLISDKFFLGGPLSLRGFENRGIGPNKENCALGNDAYWLFGAHLYTPLPFLHHHKKLSSWFKTHTFVNLGNIFSLSQLKSANEHRLQYLVSNTRLSVGTGVVVAFGNIARVELNYALPLWKLEGDKAVNGLQFGIGVNFS